jgi:mono/diheme cytochrome c family protein
MTTTVLASCSSGASAWNDALPKGCADLAFVQVSSGSWRVGERDAELRDDLSRMRGLTARLGVDVSPEKIARKYYPALLDECVALMRAANVAEHCASTKVDGPEAEACWRKEVDALRFGWVSQLAALDTNNVASVKPGSFVAALEEAKKCGPEGCKVAAPANATFERGKEIYEKRGGCIACHSVDGSPRVGGTFKGLVGSTLKHSDGSTLVVDDAYLREAILQPEKRLSMNPTTNAPYPSSMPRYEGMLAPIDVESLVLFIKAQR